MGEPDLLERIRKDREPIVSVEQFLPEQVDGNLRRRDFTKLHIAVNGLAERFFGLNLDATGGLVQHGAELDGKLVVVRKLIQEAPLKSPDTESQETNWQEANVARLKKEATAVQKRKVRNPLAESERVKTFNLTYEEAHDDPTIRLGATNMLSFEQDPIFEIIRSLEGWRMLKEAKVSPRQMTLARNAYRILLFSAGSKRYTAALSSSAAWQSLNS